MFIESFKYIIFTVVYLLIFLRIIKVFSVIFFPKNPPYKNRFIKASIFVVLVKIIFVSIFFVVAPDRTLSPDAVRYFWEMEQISEAPWEWNPFTGEGPNYAVTAKMGMSYLYGWIMFLFGGINSIYVPLALNILLGYLTCVVVFLLARKISNSNQVQLISLQFSAIYPELLFWNARILRENLTLFLIPLLLYLVIDLTEKTRLQTLFFITLLSLLVLLVRAQLILFIPLILFYYFLLPLFIWLKSLLRFKLKLKDINYKFFIILLSLSVGFYWLKDLIFLQISRAVGSRILTYVTLNYGFWMSELSNISNNLGNVLTFTTQKGYGVAGLLIAPFTIFVFTNFILMIFNFKKIFKHQSKNAGLLIFVSTIFLLVLSAFGSINIRFRSTVMPMVIPLVITTFFHYLSRYKYSKHSKSSITS